MSKLYAIWPLAIADASDVLLSVFERNEILLNSAAGSLPGLTAVRLDSTLEGKHSAWVDEGEPNARNFAIGISNAFQARMKTFSHRIII